ncbi:short-chain fatty acyl-CoA regulator family protein [Acetobacteraceae bacterium KSS8]|uniref:Short-chain fatty acyl-CoA regulator family protein n=1 Tax=Endosaccharibacter trunci TaxID=2812733 RepID=A0ABT1W882_9PROT|nr:short-chain fatty acyl-CoA regulator family protein [Acetobacteraceae bacterium KSS8]
MKVTTINSSRSRKVFAGSRLRRLRLGRQLSQAALAGRLGISPSYLSQLEADVRPLPMPLRLRVAAILGVPASHFADAEDERMASSLREVTGDPLFAQAPVSAEEANAAVRASPAVADRFLTLYKAYLALAEQHQALQHPSGGVARPLSAAQAEAQGFRSAPSFAYDEVGDWVQSRVNYFDRLDRAAERLAEAAPLGGAASLREDLARLLRDRHGISIVEDSGLLSSGTVWRLQRSSKTLLLAEEASAESRLFWIAHVIGSIEQRQEIQREIRKATFSGPEARALARVALANYFAGALIMPYGRFLAEARALRYDIERLQNRFGTSFEQVCHRLSTLQRPEAAGIPFFLVKTDIAGNVLKRSSATRFKFSRFGGPCPLWNVYRAFIQPGHLIVQVASTPDQVSYLNIARTVGRRGGAYLSRPRNVAIVIGCELSYAVQTVYATGLDLLDPSIADPIGPGCRACERIDCRHRAVPQAGSNLDTGTGERGVVPYRMRN